MSWIDWIVTATPLILLFGVGLYTRRHVKGVADFLSGGRLAGRYLLAIARAEQGAGAVVLVSAFQAISHSGFTTNWWGWLSGPVGIVLAISGWVIYRFRETRAMTLAQFFEIRYSRAFRIFAGMLGFAAGIANFGIIPVIGARFLTYILGLPQTTHLFSLAIPSYVLLMICMLTLTIALILSGGLIALMITNCLESMISSFLFLIIIFSLLTTFHWSQIDQVLTDQPPGQSFVNPFDSFGLRDFNIWYCLIMLFGMIYKSMAWQNQGAYTGAAITPHESRMGVILGGWRGMGNGVIVTLLAVCAMTFLAHPDFAAQSASAKAEIARIPGDTIREQMRIPIAVVHMLPVGVKGALCVVLLMGVFGGDGTHLLSWGSIFIQDVVLPFRKRPFTPREHIQLLRLSMIGVAMFALLFGCFFQQTEFVQMWFSVTEALFVGGAGVAIIGGLYWRKGTTAGAWVGLITGSTLSVGGILLRQFMGERFPLNGVLIGFYASLLAIVAYIVVSLLTCRRDFDMDRLLHRGKYAVKAEQQFEPRVPSRVTWGKLIGFDDHFTLGDKLLAGGLFGWSMLFFLIFVIGTIWNLVAPWPVAVWSSFWYFVMIALPLFFAVVTAIWFTWGGLLDIREFFRRLKSERVDVMDNGMVEPPQNSTGTKRAPAPLEVPI
ncbi:MAG: sodium:proline symporter [Verrucomicrobiota bacterium]